MILDSDRGRMALLVTLLSLVAFGTSVHGDAPLAKTNPDESNDGPKSRDHVLVPALTNGVIDFLRRERKPGEHVAEEDRRTVLLGGVRVRLVRLKVGDRIERGQLLGRIDDQAAQKEVWRREATVREAALELHTALQLSVEARIRFQRGLYLMRMACCGREDFDDLKLRTERIAAEAAVKQAVFEVVLHELERARLRLEMQEIRSPVSGVVEGILKHPGEAVRRFDPIFRIKPDER